MMALTLGLVRRYHELQLGTGGMKPVNEQHFAILRRHMVEVIGIHTDLLEEELGKATFEKRILTTLLRVPRHLFVPEALAHAAYQDMPLPIGFEKTISQPFMCALMTDLLAPERHETVLEVGTGLGYQTAILSELAGHVWSVEIVEEFADKRAGTSWPARLHQRRHSDRGRIAWLAGARAIRQDHRCRRRRGGARSAARTTRTNWAPRHAPRPRGCATAHSHRQRRRRGRPRAGRATGKVQPARDGHVIGLTARRQGAGQRRNHGASVQFGTFTLNGAL
jgi:Protein-L-isoaspartate(D-aspartate) O-methyltransferase (PCMT)